jgi:hypothetical protein
MKKPRRTLPATELRVHLGEALRALETEDLVIEKGGVRVALLVKYQPEAEAAGPAAEGEYEHALSKRAEPGGRERMNAVMASGWAGVEAEEIVANIYRWRDEGSESRHYSFDGPIEAEEDERQIPYRQRHLHPGGSQGQRVAEPDAPDDTA